MLNQKSDECWKQHHTGQFTISRGIRHSATPLRTDLEKGGGGVRFRALKLPHDNMEQGGANSRVRRRQEKDATMERTTACQARL